MSEYSVRVIADSVSTHSGVRLPTIEACYPRFILAEVNTHRVKSRNGASSRAIPFKRMAEAIRSNYAKPFRWLKNQPGMVATVPMEDDLAAECDAIWLDAMEDALTHAQKLADRGASKQAVNRLVEPFIMTHTLISATKWANFMKLRNHPAAAPEFEHLAQLIDAALKESVPRPRSRSEYFDGSLSTGAWHLPWIANHERLHCAELAERNLKTLPDDLQDVLRGNAETASVWPLLIMSAARSARLTTKSFDTGKESTFEEDLNTFMKLYTDPLHASPLEHQACPQEFLILDPGRTGNFHGWEQFRKVFPNEQALDNPMIG